MTGPGWGLGLAAALERLPGADARNPFYAELFRHGTLTIEIYAPKGRDPQQPHDRDELYVVARGGGEFLLGGERRSIQAGDILFVPAYLEHRFENFSDDLALWVVFYGPNGGEAGGGEAGGGEAAASA